MQRIDVGTVFSSYVLNIACDRHDIEHNLSQGRDLFPTRSLRTYTRHWFEIELNHQ
jgi:hypothetical protein